MASVRKAEIKPTQRTKIVRRRRQGANPAGEQADKRAAKQAAGVTRHGKNAAAENEEGKAQTAVRGSGLELLKKAADKRLKQNSEQLANVLVKKALRGRLDNTRMLVNLAGEKQPKKPKEKKEKQPKGRDRSQLEPEAEWVEPEVGDVWNGNGWTRRRTGESVGRDGVVIVDEELEEAEEVRESLS